MATFGYTAEEVEEYKLSLPPKISEQPYVAGEERIEDVREELEPEAVEEQPQDDPVVMTSMGIDYTQSQVDRLKAAAASGDKDTIREAINQTAIVGKIYAAEEDGVLKTIIHLGPDDYLVIQEN